MAPPLLGDLWPTLKVLKRIEGLRDRVRLARRQGTCVQQVGSRERGYPLSHNNRTDRQAETQLRGLPLTLNENRF